MVFGRRFAEMAFRLASGATPRLHRAEDNVPVTDGSPHAVVIGAGLGGLAAAIRLGARGYRVTVLERLDQPGGRARVFRQDGFVFDAGPTVITAPFLFEELFALAGAKFDERVDLVELDPFYRIRFSDGSSFNYSGRAEAMRSEIERFSPEDVEGWDRLIRQSEKIYRVGFEMLGAAPFDSWRDMARVAPAMIALENFRSVFSLVSKHIHDRRLRQALSFHPLLIGGNPLSASSIYSLITFLETEHRVHYARGGTTTIVQALVELVERLGGEVVLGAEVSEIVIEQGTACGVTLAGGKRVDAHIVVSNADSAWTYRFLIDARHRPSWPDRRLERARYSMGLFVWYFGTDRTYPDVAHHTILLGPRYEGLLEDIFERRVLADDLSLYLHRPTATDPSVAPDGCDNFYVLAPVPHLDAGVDWSTEREAYRKRIEDELSRVMLPDLAAHLVTSRCMTPRDFRADYLSFKGAAFGLEPVLTQSAFFRPHNKSSDIDNLFLVGAGTHPGAGVPGVLCSARVLDSVVPNPA